MLAEFSTVKYIKLVVKLALALFFKLRSVHIKAKTKTSLPLKVINIYD